MLASVAAYAAALPIVSTSITGCKMEPKLPSNPSTISDTRPKASTWTPETVAKKYGGRKLCDKTIAQIHLDLNELVAWDNFERQISESREATKAALRLLLTKAKENDEGQ